MKNSHAFIYLIYEIIFTYLYIYLHIVFSDKILMNKQNYASLNDIVVTHTSHFK